MIEANPNYVIDLWKHWYKTVCK